MPSPATALSIITKAMRKINALATGETPTAAEAQDGLDALNDVIETWNTANLMLYQSLPASFSTVAGQSTYSIGVGGDWASNRPLNLDNMYCTYQGVDFSIEPWTLPEYMAVPIKTQQQPIPQRFVYLNDNPLGRVILWPTPSSAMPIVLNFPIAITGAVTLATSLIMPPAYVRALQYAVAVELAPDYGGPDVSAYAKATLATIKRANRGPSIMRFDSTLTGGRRVIPVRGY